jgi:hypothetical protein
LKIIIIIKLKNIKNLPSILVFNISKINPMNKTSKPILKIIIWDPLQAQLLIQEIFKKLWKIEKNPKQKEISMPEINNNLINQQIIITF